MHPALSIIAFTTASGLGYGLAAALGLNLLDAEAPATRIAWVVALALVAGGLLSSTLHLRNPQRAWRAISQWRSSWLSREGLLALVTFVPLAVSAFLSLFLGLYLWPVGVAGSALCLATVYCTAMIYASLRAIDAWHTPLTPACYLLFSAAGGALAIGVFGAAGGGYTPLMPLGAILFLIAGWTAKLVWRRRLKSLVPLSTTESATGLGFIGRVRQFEPPHRTENYLTREMGYRVARKHADKLFGLALLLGGIVPAVICVLLLLFAGGPGLSASVSAGLALISHIAGMFVERWLFFAEARHAVTTYYNS